MPQLAYAVVDSGPLIKGVRLETLNADALVTVPEVLLEIRDRQARQMLATLPVELTTREPSGEALAAIKAFAKLTGDLPALSTVDMRVLALAWMLEKEAKGGVDHLRTAPIPPGGGRGRRPGADSEAKDSSERERCLDFSIGACNRGTTCRYAHAAPSDGDKRAEAEEAPAEEAEEEVEEEVEEVFDDAPCEVLPYLYVGSVDADANLPALREAKITHILTVASELASTDAIAAAAATRPSSGSASGGDAPSNASEGDFARLFVPMEDDESADLLGSLSACVAFVELAKAAGGRALVHCVAGRSRAPAVAAAYLMGSSDGVASTAADAIARVQQSRPWVEVAPKLRSQLAELESNPAAGQSTRAAAAVTSNVASLSLAEAAPAPAVVDVSDVDEPTPWFENLAGGTNDDAAAAAAREAKASARQRSEVALAAAAGGGGLEEADDLPWITVENLEVVQRTDPSRRAAMIDDQTRVACLTTDYAMQSVLMQMGLKLIGADGMLMRSVKQWVLRCSGCFTLQPGLDKQFCMKCGNASLVRLQAVLDARGSRRILPESGAPARVRSTNIRGTKFPMPQPKSGRHAQNMIIAEDQLEEAQAKFVRQGKARVDNVFDPDYSLDDHFGRSGKKGAGGSGAPKVGYGKRANPNDVRARPRRNL